VNQPIHLARQQEADPVPEFKSPATEPVPDSFSFETPSDPQWYKRAVFYEVLIRGFRLQRRRDRRHQGPDLAP